MKNHRIIGRIPHEPQKSRDARLRAAWLAIPSALHSRPEPRSAWDSAARETCPTSPWDRTVDPCRSALRAALRTGDSRKIASVRASIEAYLELMKAEIISLAPSDDEFSILRVAIEETKAQAGGDCAVQEVLAALLPDGTAPRPLLENAEQKLTAHESALRRCRTMLGSILRNGAPPQRMRVAR